MAGPVVVEAIDGVREDCTPSETESTRLESG
jgi:hypothetical protein